MSALQIKDPAVAAGPGAAGTEHLSSSVPADENVVVRFWNVKRLPVHLLFFKLEVLGYALSDGMGRKCRPHTAEIPFSPFQAAACTEEVHEWFGFMCRMQRYKAHTFLDALHHLVNIRIGYSVMHHVRPPDQDIRIVQYFIGQTVFRIVKGCHPDFKIRILPEGCCKSLRQSVRISLSHFCGAFL